MNLLFPDQAEGIEIASHLAPQRLVRRAQEPLVVLTVELAEVVEEWIEEHRRVHPAKAKLVSEAYGDGSFYHYGAERWLCDQAGLSLQRLHQILRKTTVTTQLGVADDLLSAMGDGWMLGWQLRIYANPHWGQARLERELEARGVALDENDRFWSYLDGRAA